VPAVVLYFQAHQPRRMRRYSVFHEDPFYFDDTLNAEICRRVAQRCYVPVFGLLARLARRHEGAFRVSLGITGSLLDQLAEFAPAAMLALEDLASTGCCEPLAETDRHSLAFLYSPQEFRRQVDAHERRVVELFGRPPRIFRHTECIYGNDLAVALCAMLGEDGRPRYDGALAEAVDHRLGYRSPHHVYRPPDVSGRPLRGRSGHPFALLLRNPRLSDDIAFRFSDRSWDRWPLTAPQYAAWLAAPDPDAEVVTVGLDVESIGERQPRESGIFEFLEALPQAVLDTGRCEFLTASQAAERFRPVGVYDAPEFISWADAERDLSAWRGNSMQRHALDELYRLERPLRELAEQAARSGDPTAVRRAVALLDDWRQLTTADHVYYMATKLGADAEVHRAFSPYDSPYDSYINFMNVLENLRDRIGEPIPDPPRQDTPAS